MSRSQEASSRSARERVARRYLYVGQRRSPYCSPRMTLRCSCHQPSSIRTQRRERSVNRDQVAVRTLAFTTISGRRGLLAVLGGLGLSALVDSVTAKTRRQKRRQRRRKRRRDNQTSTLQRCGGLAGVPCPPGFTCVDDPRDTCDPGAGGADCSGICVAMCGPTVCPPEQVCCNASCGICTPPGGACILIACVP